MTIQRHDRHDQLDQVEVDPLRERSWHGDPVHHQHPVGGGTSDPAAATHRHHLPAAGARSSSRPPLEPPAGTEPGKAQ